MLVRQDPRKLLGWIRPVVPKQVPVVHFSALFEAKVCAGVVDHAVFAEIQTAPDAEIFVHLDSLLVSRPDVRYLIGTLFLLVFEAFFCHLKMECSYLFLTVPFCTQKNHAAELWQN